MTTLPLGKVAQQAYNDASSPVTNSTAISSQDSHYSEDIESIEGDMTSEICGFDSPVGNLQRKQSTVSISQVSKAPTVVKTENGWKKKIKTELCRFWLNGQECENSQKEQGCGFAHG